MSRRLLAFLIFLTYAVETCVSRAQNDGRIHLPPAVQQGPDTRNIPVRSAEEVQPEQLKKFREVRQEEIRRDSEKLYQLSTELREYIEKNNGNFLSLDMIKKADTIEHLAHSVKQKMKDIQ